MTEKSVVSVFLGMLFLLCCNFMKRLIEFMLPMKTDSLPKKTKKLKKLMVVMEFLNNLWGLGTE